MIAAKCRGMFPGKMHEPKYGHYRLCGCHPPLTELQLHKPWLSTHAPLVCEQLPITLVEDRYED